MGAVTERSVVTLDNCMRHTKADPPCDLFELELMLGAVKELADYVCNNPFVKELPCGEPELDENGLVQELPIPIVVELWLMRKFARYHEFRFSGNNNVNISDLGSIILEPQDWTELLPVIKFK